MTAPATGMSIARGQRCFLPGLVAEAVLGEDVRDPVDGQAPPPSQLAKNLDTRGRRGSLRIAIDVREAPSTSAPSGGRTRCHS
jgi:hypothetical protein